MKNSKFQKKLEKLAQVKYSIDTRQTLKNMVGILNDAYSNLVKKGLPDTKRTKALFNAHFIHCSKEAYQLGAIDMIDMKEAYPLGAVDMIVKSNKIKIIDVFGASTERYKELPGALELQFEEEIKKAGRKIEKTKYLSKGKDALKLIEQSFDIAYQDLVKEGLPETDETRAMFTVNFFLSFLEIYQRGSYDGMKSHKTIIGTKIEGASSNRWLKINALCPEKLSKALAIL